MTFHFPPHFNDIKNSNDIYSQQTFQELFDEKKKLRLDYFLAENEAENGKKHYFDATHLLKDYLIYNKKYCPLINSLIENGKIYKIDSSQEHLEFFCLIEDIKKNHMYIKFINASDTSLPREEQANARSFVALTYRDGSPEIEKNVDKERLWWDLAIEVNSYAAYIHKGCCHAFGQEGYERSIQKTEEYFREALKYVSDDYKPLIENSLAKLREENK